MITMYTLWSKQNVNIFLKGSGVYEYGTADGIKKQDLFLLSYSWLGSDVE